jgi:hypothetical protein
MPNFDLLRSLGQFVQVRGLGDFRKIYSFEGQELLDLRPTPKLEQRICRPPSAAAYSMYFLLRSTSTVHLVLSQPEDAPCRAEEDPRKSELSQKENLKYSTRVKYHHNISSLKRNSGKRQTS